MSCNYAEGLSPYENKGKCGMKEKFDTEENFLKKVKILAEWIHKAKHTVMYTGAGISTSAGIPDFRGPKGVWTLEQKGEKPIINLSFDDAVPTKTHMALTEMVNKNIVQYVVSQNVDGLHLKSGLSRLQFSELHGNMFLDKCDKCKREFVRQTATATLGQKSTGKKCPLKRGNGRPCRGELHDTVLDWEDELPEKDLDLSDKHSRKADLCITLGTSLQIVPSGNLPLLSKKNGGKLVIINLQPTKHDKKADLIINAYVDRVMELLSSLLEFKIPNYSSDRDPTRLAECQNIDVKDIDLKPCAFDTDLKPVCDSLKIDDLKSNLHSIKKEEMKMTDESEEMNTISSETTKSLSDVKQEKSTENIALPSINEEHNDHELNICEKSKKRKNSDSAEVNLSKIANRDLIS